MSRFKWLKPLWSKMPKWLNELYTLAISWDCFITQEISFSWPEVTFDLRPVFCLTFLYLAMTCWMQLTSSCTSFYSTTRGLDDGYDDLEMEMSISRIRFSPYQDIKKIKTFRGSASNGWWLKRSWFLFVLGMTSQGRQGFIKDSSLNQLPKS